MRGFGIPVNREKAKAILREWGMTRCRKSYDLNLTGLYSLVEIAEKVGVCSLAARIMIEAWKCLHESK